MSNQVYSDSKKVQRAEKRLFYVLIGLMVLMIIMALSLSASAQQIKNAGLENWHNNGSELAPDYFVSFNPGTVTRTSTAHSGQYAVLIKNIPDTVFGGVTEGALLYGDTSAISVFRGQAFSGKPDRFKFWYKFSRAGNDTAVGVLWLVKNGVIIGTGVFMAVSNATSYTQANVPVQYTGLGQPDTIFVEFGIISGSTAIPGSQLYVDDIALDYSSGVDASSVNAALSLYPNPVSGILTLELPTSGASRVTIADGTGKTMYCKEQAAGKSSIDCSEWTNGLYFLTVQNDGGVLTRKFALSK